MLVGTQQVLTLDLLDEGIQEKKTPKLPPNWNSWSWMISKSSPVRNLYAHEDMSKAPTPDEAPLYLQVSYQGQQQVTHATPVPS